MRTIRLDEVGGKLAELIDEKDPLDEDIGLLDSKGNLKGAFITKSAYEFFLKKVEEEEDRIDLETVREFHHSGEKNDEA